jgi:putative spermidine/putrescine transport system ATP-binding protein
VSAGPRSPADPDAPALRVAGLEVGFGAAPGLRALSFSVAAGERLVVVGPSGAGKTTLLRAVAGLAPLRAGRIEIAGRDRTRLPPERRDAVYLHQQPVLFPHLSVFENVAFALRVRGRPAPEVRERVGAALAAVRLEGLGGRDPRTLSGGQRHRVALARAIVARPALLLLDEPFSALDPTLRDEVRDALLAVQRAYRPALVLVTHDLDEAGLLADRVAVLLDGRLAQVAAPERLFSAPGSLAVARFLGIANEVPGVLRPDGRFESALGALALDAQGLPAGPAVAVFHGDALRAVAGGPLSGRVLGVRHRAQRTTARVAVGEAELEMEVDRLRPPSPGEALELELDPRRVVLLPG